MYVSIYFSYVHRHHFNFFFSAPLKLNSKIVPLFSTLATQLTNVLWWCFPSVERAAELVRNERYNEDADLTTKRYFFYQLCTNATLKKNEINKHIIMLGCSLRTMGGILSIIFVKLGVCRCIYSVILSEWIRLFFLLGFSYFVCLIASGVMCLRIYGEGHAAISNYINRSRNVQRYTNEAAK